MKRRSYCNIFQALALAWLLSLLLVEVHLQTAVAIAQEIDIENDDPTCSLDNSQNSDCTTSATSSSSSSAATSDINTPTHNVDNLQDLTRQVIALTDETFDELTSSPTTPATWLIMFKTDGCALCKKAKPVFESLAVDYDIVAHNDKELTALKNNNSYHHQQQQSSSSGSEEKEKEEEEEEEEEDKTPKGPVYVYDPNDGNDNNENETPPGPIYIATIDANWSGRDTAKRFDIDATPTIFVLRNKGGPAVDVDDDSNRSYYMYRGQRAVYPLRKFVLGGFALRKKMTIPPPLLEEERKPNTLWGRFHITILVPTASWAGGIVGKLLLAWFLFMGGLGLFMRVHNYAWGDNADDDDDDDKHEKELQEEKAKGRADYEKSAKSSEEKSAERQRIMWERKAANRAKFAANREARRKKMEEEKKGKASTSDGENGNTEGNNDDEDDFVGVGISVKKSDVQKLGQKDGKKKV